MRKGILFFSTKSLRDGGGYQEWLTQTSGLLSEKYRVGVMTGTVCDYNRWTTDEAASRIKERVQYHKETMYHRWGRWCVPSVLRWPALVSIFRQYEFIYLNHFFRYRDPITKILARISGAKIIWGFHDSLRRAGRGMYSFQSVWRATGLLSDVIHTINTDSTRYFRRYTKKTFFVPNYILNKELPQKKTAAFQGPMVFIGNYDKRKGIDLLLAAIPNILKKHPQQIFHFFGSGNKARMITELATRFPGNVVNFGYITNKTEIFSKKSFLILCSREEPFGLVVIEAMSHGIPVVVSKTNGPKDIVIEGKDGFFIDALDPNSIEKSLNKAVSTTKTEYEQMSDHAFTSVRERYTGEIFKSRFEKMLASLKA